VFDAINRQSKVPYYHQLYGILRDKIISGAYLPGQALPTEQKLIEAYEISRTTVRHALEQLVNEGLVYRQSGRGTFVAHPAVEQGIGKITSFTEDMRQRGFVPGTEVLNAGLMQAPADIGEKLGVGPDEELALIMRLRLADGEPMSVEESHLRHGFCPGVLVHDYARHSLTRILEREYGIALVRAKQVIRAIPASNSLARRLNIREGDPLLFIERVSYAHSGEPIEYLRIYHRGDRYSFLTELGR